jgi:hypothetical protein
MERLRRWAGSLPLILCVGGLPTLLAGCNSFALDDGIPNTAPTSTVVSNQPTASSGPLVRRQTGTYPTFDGSLTAANTQIGDEDAAGTEAQLTALTRARANGSVSDAEYQRRVAELRSLAANHGQDAQTAIAN